MNRKQILAYAAGAVMIGGSLAGASTVFAGGGDGAGNTVEVIPAKTVAEVDTSPAGVDAPLDAPDVALSAAEAPAESPAAAEYAEDEEVEDHEEAEYDDEYDVEHDDEYDVEHDEDDDDD